MKRAKPDDPMEKRARKAIGIQLANDRPWLIPEIARFARKEVARALRTPAGMINRKMACPICGPKFERRYKKFCAEVSLLKREGKKRGKS